MPTIITIACHKGGVGKTTTASSLGGLLANSGKKVLLIDLDAQLNLTNTFIREWDEDIFNAFLGKYPLPIVNIRENLDLVPSNFNMCSVDMTFAAEMNRESLLQELIEPVKKRYDYIIIDSPAQLGIVTLNALKASQYVIVPMSCDAYSANGLMQLEEFVEKVRLKLNKKIKILGVIITKFRRSRLVDILVEKKLREEYKDKVFATVIRENTALVQAPLKRQDIATYARNSNGAKDYAALLEEIENQIN